MSAHVLEELLLLCRAAAEAGEDWRRQLERRWLPQLLRQQEPQLRAALLDWTGKAPASPEALLHEALLAVVEAMEQAGYR
jgi:hypothetical protein